jgi:hypothetical protein
MDCVLHFGLTWGPELASQCDGYGKGDRTWASSCECPTLSSPSQKIVERDGIGMRPHCTLYILGCCPRGKWKIIRSFGFSHVGWRWHFTSNGPLFKKDLHGQCFFYFLNAAHNGAHEFEGCGCAHVGLTRFTTPSWLERFPLAHTLCTPPLIILAPLTSFPLLQSLGRDNRLVISWQVLHLASPQCQSANKTYLKTNLHALTLFENSLWDAPMWQILTDCYAHKSLQKAECKIKWVGGLWTNLTFLETLRLPLVNFWDELSWFSKPRWITHP